MPPFNKTITIIFLGILSSGWWETMNLELPPHLAKAGNFQFLTNASLTITTTYLLLNLVGANRKLLTYLHHLSANLEFVVTVCYWSLIYFFPTFLNTDSFPFKLDLELKIHLLPYVFLLLDRKPSISFKSSALMGFSFLAFYWTAIELHVFFNGADGVTKFPYPFLNGISFLERLKWLGLFLGVSLFNYPIEKILNLFT